MEAKKSGKWTKLKIGLLILLVFGGIIGYIAWDRGFREHSQPAWVTQDDATRFMYASIYNKAYPDWGRGRDDAMNLTKYFTCHAEDSGRVGRPLPLAQVGTNKDRLDTWGKKYAIESNKVVRNFGIERRGLVEEDSPGYNVAHLDGIWLRAPYLHNGSVPSLRDLLRPPAERPAKFYRGYDVYDPVNMGFIAQGSEAEKVGTLYDVSRKGNGNGGHLFGTTLRAEEKETLLEYLKTL